MEYERIHTLQTGVLSPIKLIMKLTGSTNQHQRKKDGSKSNTTSTRTSPSKLQGSDSDQLVKDSLLLSAPDEAEDFNKEVAGSKLEPSSAGSCSQRGQSSSLSQDSVCEDGCRKKKQQQLRKAESADRLTPTPPEYEQSSLDYDSNASSSSFEFPNGERARPRQLSRSFSRPPASSKWNDAEKWVMRSPVNEGSKKKSFGQSQMIARVPMISVSPGPESSEEDQVVRGGGLSRMLDMRTVDFCQPASRSGLDEFSFAPSNVTATRSADKAGMMDIGIAVRPVAMRDTGTEMTPIGSQDPSRTSTPAGATTPLCSPTISIPSTPGREPPPVVSRRFRREEVMIQVWESHQKSKLEAEMRKIEAKVEEMRCQCKTKMLQKIAAARHRSEKKRARAEARKNRQAERSAAMAGYIRRKGHLPYYYICCAWA
uniref:Remorin C-terminal domain-containing protein n=1 Tax=Kalanchoe fedtschenkoi TaxID=63787 RepID=A0A7N0SW49_KALFE